VLRSVLAPNPSPLTLEGTRSYLVGRERVAVIDPGPSDPAHLDAVAGLTGDGVLVAVLITHAHPDHDEGADELAARFDAPVRSVHRGTLADGDRIETDAGALVAVATPGHTPDHIAFHWPAEGVVFCGDLMTGGLETALVAKPEGDLGAYLDSLDRVRALEPKVILPAHGPSFDDPPAALDAYIRHRREREAQVLTALEQAGGAAGAPLDLDALVSAVYGAGLDPALRAPAAGAVLAYLEHLEATGRVRRVQETAWARVRGAG